MVNRVKSSKGVLDESNGSKDPAGPNSFASNGSPAIHSNADDGQDSSDLDESRYVRALLMHLNGQTHRQIAKQFGKSDRTIRRWIENAKEKSLVRIDNLDAAAQLSEFLLLLDDYRTKLTELYQRAQVRDDGRLEFRCLRELMAVEEKRFRTLEKMGLFDYWDHTFGNQKVVKWLTTRRDDLSSSRTDFIVRQKNWKRYD